MELKRPKGGRLSARQKWWRDTLRALGFNCWVAWTLNDLERITSKINRNEAITGPKIYTPYPNQRAGIDWIISKPACGLFWGMGTGKTVTTLTAIDRLLYDYLEPGPWLVVAPKRVAEDTWSKEAAKWEHLAHLTVSKIMGTSKERAAALAVPADVYVINRENVVWLAEYLGRRWPFRCIVLDELSSFKSAQAKRWKAMRRIRGRISRIIGLTGTPRPNGLEDLWPEIYLLDQGERLGRTLGQFRARYLAPEKMSGHIVYSYRPAPGAEEAVYSALSDICTSIRKEDVLSLPGQIYEDITLTTPTAILKRYKAFEREKVLLLQIGGSWYFISDITMRMLTPRKLYNAMGFPPDYIIDHDYRGNVCGKTKQVARCGNAVCPPMATALVRANLPEWCGKKIISMAQLEKEIAV